MTYDEIMALHAKYAEVVNDYPKEFKKCGVHEGTLIDMELHCKIIETKENYEGRKLISRTEKEVLPINYAYVVSSVGFFGDRISKAYTYAGYIATEFTAKNPYSNQRVKRIYRIEKRTDE